MTDVTAIINLQKQLTDDWHQQNIHNEHTDLLKWVVENHANNYQLWHEEDKARRDDKGFEYVYNAKRNIDRFNQQRNDCMEQMDRWFVDKFNPAQAHCEFNSESPGMIIDRLSILALKAYHMTLQTKRSDASAEHIAQCEHKLNVINMQLTQLSESLKQLLDDVAKNKRSFKVYYQFKMYNDPKLNPELYKDAR